MNTNPTLAAEVANWLGEILLVDIDPSRMEASLERDYGANSMDIVDMAESMERRYGIVVTNDQLTRLKTFGDVIGLIPN